TREAWWTTVIASVVRAAAALTIAARRLTASGWTAAAIVLAAASSRAFVEFSTSGLENSLAHLVLAATLVVHLRRAPGPRALTGLGLGLSGLVLCRPDLGLVGLPIVIDGWIAARRE